MDTKITKNEIINRAAELLIERLGITSEDVKSNTATPDIKERVYEDSPTPVNSPQMYKNIFGINVKNLIVGKEMIIRRIFASKSNIIKLPIGVREFTIPGTVIGFSINKSGIINVGDDIIKFEGDKSGNLPLGNYQCMYLGHPKPGYFGRDGVDYHFFEFIKIATPKKMEGFKSASTVKSAKPPKKETIKSISSENFKDEFNKNRERLLIQNNTPLGSESVIIDSAMAQ